VRALSGEQYATPEALRLLGEIRSGAHDDAIAVFSALDPANPYGVLPPGCGVMREAGNLLVASRGRVILGLNGRDLVVPQPLEGSVLHDAVSRLMRFRAKVTIETIDGIPALESAQVATLAEMGFHSDGKSLVYDGLPGPRPARAVAQGVQH